MFVGLHRVLSGLLFFSAALDNCEVDVAIDGQAVTLGLWDYGAREDYGKIDAFSYPNTDVRCQSECLMHRPYVYWLNSHLFFHCNTPVVRFFVCSPISLLALQLTMTLFSLCSCH
jgi:hypothetical protein